MSGLILGSGPCLATCGPILISYIAATRKSPGQGIMVWLLFSLSRISVYPLLGVSVFFLGEFLVKEKLTYISQYVYITGGAVIVAIGILTIIRGTGSHSRACAAVSQWASRRLSGIQPVALGLILGLLPCAPLLAVLSYIGLISFSWQRCIFYSLIFGLGTLISPLILLALGAGAASQMLFKRPRVYNILRLLCGLIILFFGIQLILRTIYG
ncbi:sulfite exporter TauE/SafE family protein [Candidatus Omnitrophota bacterium]